MTYFKVGEIEDVLVKELKPITSIKEKSTKKDIETATSKKVKIELKKEPKIEEEKTGVKEIKPEISKDSGEKADVREKAIENQAARDSYFLKVREKIELTLEKNTEDFIKKRKGFVKEGDVYAILIIDKNGLIKDLYLYKYSGKENRILQKIALDSIKEAAPFPTFSAEMKKNELLLRVPIRFSRE